MLEWQLLSPVTPIQIDAKEESILDVKKEVKQLKKELKSGLDPKVQK